MPQLMPLNWIFSSIIMMIMIIFLLSYFYSNYMMYFMNINKTILNINLIKWYW